MISTGYIRTFARYNRWQNRSLYGAADTLSSTERLKDRGAFFGSIERTLTHLLWGDSLWMHRFAGTPKPEGGIAASAGSTGDWAALTARRVDLDATIIAWADGLAPEWLAGDLTWFSGAVGRELTRPRALLVAQMFNHQTHHRGQVHAMLTAAGARPDDTDLMLLPDVVPAQ